MGWHIPGKIWAAIDKLSNVKGNAALIEPADHGMNHGPCRVGDAALSFDPKGPRK